MCSRQNRRRGLLAIRKVCFNIILENNLFITCNKESLYKYNLGHRSIGVTSTINDTWVNGTLINEGDKCVHAKIDAVDTYQLQWAGHLENFWPGYI